MRSILAIPFFTHAKLNEDKSPASEIKISINLSDDEVVKILLSLQKSGKIQFDPETGSFQVRDDIFQSIKEKGTNVSMGAEKLF